MKKVMYGYTYERDGILNSLVHYSKRLCLNYQQYIEYTLGIPCMTYVYEPDATDLSRFETELVKG